MPAFQKKFRRVLCYGRKRGYDLGEGAEGGGMTYGRGGGGMT